MDTLLRHWHMLRRIPRFPRKVSTAELEASLDTAGYPTSRRTIQRDLDKLSVEFPLITDGNKPSGWSWQEDAEIFDVPGMDTSAALTFHMVDAYLTRLLPKGCLASLTPHLRRAATLLQQMEGGGLKNWPGKVRIVQRAQVLQPTEVVPEVMATVYEALFHDRQFLGEYRSRGEKGVREFVVNPLGLIFNDPVIYLVATLWDYQDVRLLALHRFVDARLLMDGCRRPAGFDLDAFLASGAVTFPVTDGAERLKLVIRMTTEVAHHLRESRLCDDQKIAPDGDEFVRVSGTVADTHQLRWWLLGFGAKVEVLEPASLRTEFAQVARTLDGYYSQG
jgi:predicted DNA-binding transcriptional regulator YafY